MSTIDPVPIPSEYEIGSIEHLRSVTSTVLVGEIDEEPYIKEVSTNPHAVDSSDYAVQLWLHVPVRGSDSSIREIVFFLVSVPHNSELLDLIREEGSQLAAAMDVGTTVVAFASPQPSHENYEFDDGTFRAPHEGFVLADERGAIVTFGEARGPSGSVAQLVESLGLASNVAD